MEDIDIANLRREYKSRALDRTNLEKDPMKLFSQWFTEATNAGEYEPNAMAIATTNADCVPSLRMVLLKGLEHGGFCFYTNYRSQKGRELLQNPQASLLFWWQTLERQVRINGKVEKLSSEASDEYFNSRPEGSRLGAIASPQSKVIEDRSELEENYTFASAIYAETGTIKRPEHWGGFILYPSEFEFWQGRENRMHDRFRYRNEDNSWKVERLAP